mgnify:FL=1
MIKKITLLVFLSVPLMILADDHGKKEGKSPKEMKKMEMMKKEMERWGRWKAEDCRKVSEASGVFLYFAGESIKEGEKHEKMGHQEKADKNYLDAMALAELAAKYAKNYEAYCKK